MSEPTLDFANMIAPVSPAAFLAENWEIKPLHISRSQSSFYQELLTKRDIDLAIASGGLRFPSIQMAKGGRFLPADMFTRNIRSGDDIFTGVPNLERITKEYQSGATISLPGFHRAWKPLDKLAASVEAELGHVVHANVYLTPGNAAGFAPHFDTHDVFILQIAGSKLWSIYEPPVVLPHRSQSFHADIFSSSKPLLRVELRPGDLLYLPRGFVHSTTTSDSFSVHVTLGITVYTWVEILSEWAQSSKSNARFRRALAPRFLTSAGTTDALKKELLSFIYELEHNTDFDALVAAFVERVHRGRLASQPEFDADRNATVR